MDKTVIITDNSNGINQKVRIFFQNIFENIFIFRMKSKGNCLIIMTDGEIEKESEADQYVKIKTEKQKEKITEENFTVTVI